MRKIYKISAWMLVAGLSACGGGGGDSGGEPYRITLTAAKTQLPVNITSAGVGQGVFAPYTTSLYVHATMNGSPIPGGEKVFECNMESGLDSGSLYYLDGDPEHEDAAGNPLAYRSIVLGANAGGSSFHFHAKNQAGSATIRCSVKDPKDPNKGTSTTATIVVGGSTGKAASIQGIAAHPVLGAQGNLNNLRTSTAVQAYVLDDANQPLPAASKANLQVRLAAGGASSGARLFQGLQSGGALQLTTTGGVGLFSLQSGTSEGTVLVELTADRYDNDITNGVQDPITHFLAMPVSNGTVPGAPADPLALVDMTPPAATNGLPYSYALSVKGGVAPYTWTALGGLPEGLTLSPAGVLSGTPAGKLIGTLSVAVRVADSKGTSITGNFELELTGSAAPDPATNPLSINLAGCGTDTNVACALPDAPVGGAYQYVLSATGGGSGAVTWAFEAGGPAIAPPAWLTLTTSGILTGAVPATCGQFGQPFFIRATRGAGVTTLRKVTIKGVTGPGGTC